jgi:glycosyltransferase involved in cell wall biosynthesis
MSTGMKILMLCDFFHESLTFQENLLAKYYHKLGHAVTIVTSTTDSVFDYVNLRFAPSKPRREYATRDAKVIRLAYRFNLAGRVRVFPALDGILERECPDVIFVHNVLPNLGQVRRYKRSRPGVRLILDFHGDYSNSGRGFLSRVVLHRGIGRFILRRALSSIDALYPVTPESAKFMSDMYGVPPARMEILSLGADTDLARSIQALDLGAQLRDRYGIGRNDIVIFSGGKLTPAKHTEKLIEAFQVLNDAVCWLVIVGDADAADAAYLAQLKQMASGNQQILFPGWLESRSVLEHMAMSDFAVFPASQSILWQQAIGMGLPVVIGDPKASPTGTQDFSYLNKYENVILTDQSTLNSEWLTKKLSLLVQTASLRAKMSEGARRVAAELLDWNVIIQRTLYG